MCVHGNAGKGTATLTVAANFDLGKLIRGSAYGAILIGKPEAKAETIDPGLMRGSAYGDIRFVRACPCVFIHKREIVCVCLC